MQNKICGVVSLPQGKKGWSKGELIKFYKQYRIAEMDNPNRTDCEAQYLYITDREADIKKHDNVISKNGKHIYYNVQGDTLVIARNLELPKVIFTTDPKCKLPTIPAWFIQAYADSNGSIKEVGVAKTTIDSTGLDGVRNFVEVPKITDNNECVLELVGEKVAYNTIKQNNHEN